MTAVATPQKPQHMAALEQANRTRLAVACIKHNLKSGELTFREALEHQDAGSMKVLELLMAQHRWGRQRALRTLNVAAASQAVPVWIAESRRIRDLTPRQREALVRAVEGYLRAA